MLRPDGRASARKSFVLAVMGMVVFFLCSFSSANVPDSINYQGKLTTASGGCLNDTVSMTFTIYSDDQGTVVDWTETQNSVIVKEGIFNVLLGSETPIPASVFDGSTKYLGVQVETDPEMRPLKPMVSVAYAFRSEFSDTAEYARAAPAMPDDDWVIDGDNIYHEQGNVGIGTTSPGRKLHISGNSESPPTILLQTTEAPTDSQTLALYASVPTGDFSIARMTDDGGSLLRIDLRIKASTGNVGIGTTAPVGKLHVETDKTYAGYFRSDSLSDNTHVLHSEFTGTGSYNATAVYGKSSPADGSGYGGLFEGGRKGVYGTVSPTGSDTYWGIDGHVSGGSGTNYGVRGYAEGSGTNYGVYGSAGGAGTNYAGYFNGDLCASGNVGIGTMSPAEKLDVAGTAQMTGFKMPTDASSGYVLTSDASGVGTWQEPSGACNWSVTDSVLYTNNYWGIARGGAWNALYGDSAHTMVNLGVACTTGTSGYNFYYLTISGGLGNKATNYFTTVGGGRQNTASNTFSTVGGGYDNTASGNYCTVGGGFDNTASHTYSTVGGGHGNTASGSVSTVGAGVWNTASGWVSTVGGGDRNTASDSFSTVGGGAFNTASGERSTVGGGYENLVQGGYSAILGGKADTITGTADFSYLFGIGSKLTEDSTFMVDMPHIRFGDETNGYEFPTSDGASDQVMATDGSGQLSWVDGGGCNWSVTDSVLYTNNWWGIARGGAWNVLYGDSAHTMVNFGVACTTGTNGENHYYSTVSGGYGNAASGIYSTVGGGRENPASGSYSTVGGGAGNTASFWGTTVGGGNNNTASGWAGTVGGGQSNTASDFISTVSGGQSNTASGGYSTVGGGWTNTASGSYSTVGGGFYNTATGINSTVGGGRSDTSKALYGGVFSGYSNLAGDEATDTAAFVGGGWDNSATAKYATVGGGRGNTASREYSTVGGGYQNSNSGLYSVIPGGYRDTLALNAYYSMAFGRYVYVNNSNRVVFFDGSYPGRLGINRDDHDGGILHPIHVGTNAASGNGAYLTGSGWWTNTCSRNFKENFKPLDGQDLLAKISNLAVESWEFKDSDERHIGPYAEDFVGAFDVGVIKEDGTRDNMYLAAGDVAGVALAGVKELTRQNRELRQIIEDLRQRIAQLEKAK